MFRPKMAMLSVAAMLVAGGLVVAEFQQPLPLQDRDTREAIPQERTQLPRPETDTHVHAEATLVRSSELEEVRNPANEKLASVSEYVIDMNNGKVKYVILSHGGFLGIREDLLPVPIEALSVRRDDEADKRFLVLTMDREKLESAPSFDSGEWPNFNDREWSQRINQFYGVTEERRIDSRLPADADTEVPDDDTEVPDADTEVPDADTEVPDADTEVSDDDAEVPDDSAPQPGVL